MSSHDGPVGPSVSTTYDTAHMDGLCLRQADYTTHDNTTIKLDEADYGLASSVFEEMTKFRIRHDTPFTRPDTHDCYTCIVHMAPGYQSDDVY